jgi:hypothetical protein
MAFRGRGPTVPFDFASKLKDSNPIPTLECATRIASVKQSLRQGSGRAFTRLNHVKQFDQPSDAAVLGKKAKLDDVFIVDGVGKIGLQRAR